MQNSTPAAAPTGAGPSSVPTAGPSGGTPVIDIPPGFSAGTRFAATGATPLINPSDTFVHRHIGPSEAYIANML